MQKKTFFPLGKSLIRLLRILTFLIPAMASAQVSTSDAAWCEVVEQALADKGIEANVHSDISSAIRSKLSFLYPDAAPRMNVQGNILSIAEQKKEKAKTVYINLGRANEVRNGDIFTVYAPVLQGNNSGITSIGTLTVSEVQGNTLALCKVKKGEEDIYTNIQKGVTLTVQSKW